MERDPSKDSDRTTEPPSSPVKSLNQPRSPEMNLVPISQEVVPFIFEFKICALARIYLPEGKHIHPVTRQIFDFLRNKILSTRYSNHQASHANLEKDNPKTRMKSEEKMKFLMRGFQQIFITKYSLPKTHLRRFNVIAQRQFFARKEVKDHFLEYLPEVIKIKKERNKIKMRQVQKIIQEAIYFAIKQPSKAHQRMLQLKRMQLPWTQNMFTDIEQVAMRSYQLMTQGPRVHQKQFHNPEDEEREEVEQWVNEGK